jgi:hypothetical protein
LLGPFLCYNLLFQTPTGGSFACVFPLLVAGIIMFPLGLLMVYSGTTSLERTVLMEHGIPEPYFLYFERNRIRRKKMQLVLALVALYLLIFLLFIVPRIIEYNEFWADGHSGARSPFGSGGECCSIILIPLFFSIYAILSVVSRYLLKRNFIKQLESRMNDYRQ